MTIADVQQQNQSTSIIKTELDDVDDINNQLSPAASSVSYSSSLSGIAQQSGPGECSALTLQQQYYHQQHVQQITGRLFLTPQNNVCSASFSNDVPSENADLCMDLNYRLPCPLCEIPLEPRAFRQHLDRHYPRDSPICPVIQCGRRFAHPNSVRNHMRIKHTLQWAKMKAMRSSGGTFSGISEFK